MSQPDVSVLMPSYKYGRFMREALDSCLEQSGVDVEVQVQDAGSEDGSIDLLRGYGDNVIWRSEPDDGQSDALNRALERATGDRIAWLNADEFYLPGAMKHLVDTANATGADVVFGDAIFVDEDGRILRLLPQHRLSGLVIESYGTFISTCATLFRREALPPHPWDVSLKRVMDWDLYMQLLRAGRRFVHTPYPVAAFRVHEGQVTAGSRDGAVPEYEKVRSRYGVRQTPVRRAAAYATHALLKLRAGSYTRQLKVRRSRGRSLSWAGDVESGDGLNDVFAAYGTPPAPTEAERIE